MIAAFHKQSASKIRLEVSDLYPSKDSALVSPAKRRTVDILARTDKMQRQMLLNEGGLAKLKELMIVDENEDDVTLESTTTEESNPHGLEVLDDWETFTDRLNECTSSDLRQDTDGPRYAAAHGDHVNDIPGDLDDNEHSDNRVYFDDAEDLDETTSSRTSGSKEHAEQLYGAGCTGSTDEFEDSSEHNDAKNSDDDGSNKDVADHRVSQSGCSPQSYRQDVLIQCAVDKRR